MSARIGRFHYLYRNTGTYASPVWNHITAARDVTVTESRETVEVDARGYTIKSHLLGSRTIEMSVELLYDPDVDDQQSLRTAYVNGTEVEFLALDGPVGTTGSRGLRFTGVISEFTRSEPLGDVATISMTVVPSATAANPPAEFVVP